MVWYCAHPYDSIELYFIFVLLPVKTLAKNINSTHALTENILETSVVPDLEPQNVVKRPQ